MVDEIKLIDRIKHGDRRALDTLVKAYYQNVFAYFYYHTQNRETAMDLTQEVFVKVVASIETYENRGRFRSWLFTICANHLRNHWKYGSTHDEYELEEESEEDMAVSWQNITDSTDLLNALSQISTDQRDCVILKYYYGFTSREIAEMLHIKEPTVKARIRYGLSKIAKLLRGDETGGKEQ
ncbi:RNA polymerase sigma factor [Coprothermobacter platensis]|uniref:RNA polymerase sigma factor n=1 Tax=Coprothermobacter platensis TaxID=108819 RepID=UPI0003A6976D|nr:RNA polymerase sigma factor [Coprothermobacter platensis]